METLADRPRREPSRTNRTRERCDSDCYREVDLAERLAMYLDRGRLPDIQELRALFVPDTAGMPEIVVALTALAVYDELGSVRSGEAV